MTTVGFGGPPGTGFAAVWQKWFPMIEAGAAPVSQRMLALAGLGGSEQVLDVGTGVGEPALTAAKALGPGGRVTGVDHDPDMVDFARRRAADEGLDNVTFTTMRAEELDFPPASFDVVLCRWSLMFVDDLAQVLGSIHGLLRPGGRFAATIWGPPEWAPGLSLPKQVLHKRYGLTPEPFGAKSPFALSDTNAFCKTVEAAGFSGLEDDWVSAINVFATPEAYLENRQECTGPIFADLPDLSAAEQQAALTAIRTALEAYRQPDGSLRFENRAYVVAARRPAP